jgi:hypothetical protein
VQEGVERILVKSPVRTGNSTMVGGTRRKAIANAPLPLKGLLGRLSVPDLRRQTGARIRTASRRRSADFAGASSAPEKLCQWYNYSEGIRRDALLPNEIPVHARAVLYGSDLYIFLVRTVLYGTIFGIRSWGTPSDAILEWRSWQACRRLRIPKRALLGRDCPDLGRCRRRASLCLG